MNNRNDLVTSLLKKLPSRPRGLWLAASCCLAATVVIVLIGRIGFHASADTVSSVAKRPKAALTVSVAQAKSVQFDHAIEASGPIVAWQEAIVASSLSGPRLDELSADVGDVVHRGQVLARYDSAGLRALEAQAVASVEQARAAAKQASLNNNRAANLKGSGAISDQDLLQLATLADTAKAQLAAAQASLVANEVQLGYATVVAPDDGVIIGRSATLGAVATIGQELFRLIRRGKMEWHAQLTPEQAALVVPGQPVTVSLPNHLSASGRVRLLAPSADPQSRLLTAYVDLTTGKAARIGFYCSGQIHIGLHTSVRVPVTSVVVRDGNSYVFVIRKLDGIATIQRRKITTGRSDAMGAEVLSGLDEGETVVSLGAGFIDDGDVVRVVTNLQDK